MLGFLLFTLVHLGICDDTLNAIYPGTTGISSPVTVLVPSFARTFLPLDPFDCCYCFNDGTRQLEQQQWTLVSTCKYAAVSIGDDGDFYLGNIGGHAIS